MIKNRSITATSNQENSTIRTSSIRRAEKRPSFETDEGLPFFYLADTAWEMLHRLNFAETSEYLRVRAEQGFTVIQTVVLSELGGLRVPNANGDLPLHDNDPERPNEAYFAHINAILNIAEDLGLQLALLPSWGDKWYRRDGEGPEIFSPKNAEAYGFFLGERYRGRSIIWIMGGDRPVQTDTHREILEAMAKGIRTGAGPDLAVGFHPPGGSTSADFFPQTDWLEFHMTQTGHVKGQQTNYVDIAKMRMAAPGLPCLDGEPVYEDHPVMLPPWIPSSDYWGAYEVRRAAWWALLSGAAGHVYGCHPVWQFYDFGQQPINGARRYWREALHLPGANQMRHVRKFFEEFGNRPWIPLENAIACPLGDPLLYVPVARTAQGDVIAAYLPLGGEVTFCALPFSVNSIQVFNPTSGTNLNWQVTTVDDKLKVTLPENEDRVVVLYGSRNPVV